MKFPITQLSDKGREMLELSHRIKSISESAIGIDGAVTACYHQGGVGYRIQSTAISILDQSRNIEHLADTLVEAARIYTMAENNISTVTYQRSGEAYVPRVQMQYYNSRVSDTELLKLTDLAYTADKARGNRAEVYAKLLNIRLPDNDPLKKISTDQITYVHDDLTGFSAFVISDGTSATVVFLGTNLARDIGDVIADAQLFLGITSAQADEANRLIDILSHSHSNIVVTGHSLGGYLATSATLHNEGVDRCVVFDPPGRWGDLFPAKDFSRSRASKVTTYENKNSKISWVGSGVGKVVTIELDDEKWYDLNHGSNKMLDEMEKIYGTVNSFWS